MRSGPLQSNAVLEVERDTTPVAKTDKFIESTIGKIVYYAILILVCLGALAYACYAGLSAI
jgi:hypothetical protein